MNASQIAEEVANHMGPFVSDPKLLAECESICRVYNIAPEMLKYKWEALNYNNVTASSSGLTQPFTMDSVASLKAQAQRELNQQAAKKRAPAKKAANTATVNRARMPAFMNRNSGMRTKEPTVASGEAGAGMFEAGPSKVAFAGPYKDAEAKKQRSYRYMYAKLAERGQALDSRIDKMGVIVQKHYNIPELGDPSASTDEETVVVGRIVHDIESPSKLTEGTLTLEGSNQYSFGKRVPLKFAPNVQIRGGTGSHQYGLFPGAIAAFRGKNGGGGAYMVSEILALPPVSPPASSKAKSDEHDVFLACGPYTTNDDLEYRPWSALLKALKTSRPAVVVLIGPFIDSSHPLLVEGDVDMTPLELFHSKILEPLQQHFLDLSPGSIAVMIPDVKDVTISHAVFPQSEFGSEVAKGDPRIHLLPNPTTFTINGTIFGASSVDVLFHLRKEEVLKRVERPGEAEDGMVGLCRHILEQRSFYPIFPALPDVPLDVTHSEGMYIQEGVDLLILPSRLKQFSKSVHGTTAINPGFVTKCTCATLKIGGSDYTVDIKKFDEQ